MRRPVAIIAGLIVVHAGAAFAQGEGGTIAVGQGAVLYEENCALCHQPDGAGDPPTFPALAGNEALTDVDKIVRNISQGEGNMPPFPDLAADQIAALATYIRTSWGNDFGAAPTDVVTASLEQVGEADGTRTIWDGIYTEAQAERGKGAYTGPCGLCHGRRLNGAPDDPDMRSSPPLARAKFLRNWEGQSLATLYEFTRATMPQNNPGYLDGQVYMDIIAYMLSVSGAPTGEEELSPETDGLARIAITPQP